MTSRKPILVTGTHRSGSTWVGRMIALSPDVVYVHEPFNLVGYDPGICNIKFDYWFTYISLENEARFYKSVKKMIGLHYNLIAALRVARNPGDVVKVVKKSTSFLKYRIQSLTTLVKDPIAVLSTEWLTSRFDMNPVVLIRHPAAFVRSIIKKNWTYPFSHFLAQPILMRDYLQPFAVEISKCAKREMPILEQACLLWRIIYSVVSEYQIRHPDWIFLRHEDISREPQKHFKDLYARFELDYSPRVQKLIEDHTNPFNPKEPSEKENVLKRNSESNIWNWKHRLEGNEVAYIRKQVESISQRFYTDEDW